MPKVVKKCRIEKLPFPANGMYWYNVKEMTSIDGGHVFYYCGIGKYCRTFEEANEYVMRKMKEDQ